MPLPWLPDSVRTYMLQADQALETKLTKVIKETTSKDTAQVLPRLYPHGRALFFSYSFSC